MTTEQHELLGLLSYALFSTPQQPNELSKHIISEAINHSVLPIITSIADDASYDNLSMLQLARNLQVMYAHAELHEIFTTNDIPYVILKGSAAAAYYPNPNVRVLGDVDFYTTEVERASAVLEEVGFMPSEDHEHSYHQVYHRDQISVELHWGIPGVPKGRTDVQALFDDIIERSVIA